MILQALTEYYQTLAECGKIAPPGWGKSKIAYALCINDEGELEEVISLLTEKTQGKKTIFVPRWMQLPAPVKRTSGVKSNFLWDHAGYLLGIDLERSERALTYFQVCKNLHENLLAGVDSHAAGALLAFFRNWNPNDAMQHPALLPVWEEILSNVNLVFRYQGRFVHEDSLIQKAWDHYYSGDQGKPRKPDKDEMVCLVTGERSSVESTHPSIKNVRGAQSSGAALVSFNAPAFCSYGKEQNFNAPVSKTAAFSYTTALNHLLADKDHVYSIGDATVVCWAKSGDSAYQNFLGWAVFGQESTYALSDLQGALNNLCQGRIVDWEEARLDPDMEFYILGLAPNASRLSVRFFYRNSFGHFLRNVQAHYERLSIVKPKFAQKEALPIWKLLGETVNRNSRVKMPVSGMSGAVMNAILTNTRYPATLLNGLSLRIRADQRDAEHPEREFKLNWRRAAILKAYYLKNIHRDVPKEVLTVSLNQESLNVPYNLGRLFSVLETIQQSVNPGLNMTIKDRYFNSASATPSMVFPVLLNLAQKHMRKLEEGKRIYMNKQLTELLSRVGESFPVHLNLAQQGSFQLGYYHQTQYYYTNKEEK